MRPGHYVATVEDAATGERDVVEVHVGTPGKFRSLVREVGLLQKGDALTLDSAEALSLRVLPGLDTPFKQLVDATADYGHLCCEQTAAKILAAVVMWLTSEGPGRRKKAESVIVAGIARERTMWKRGLGFAMYPESEGVNAHWGGLAARHLWSLTSLQGAPGVSGALRTGGAGAASRWRTTWRRRSGCGASPSGSRRWKMRSRPRAARRTVAATRAPG